MIKVGKKWDANAQYIGRGSPMGNPFVMENQSDAERNRVCDEYEQWIRKQIANNNPRIINELRRLNAIHNEKGELTLGCFCAPKRCHGDFIKTILEFHNTEK